MIDDRLLPMRDLRGTARQGIGGDLSAAFANTFMAVPQGVAYAIIAGLPPAMGLWAASIPTIIGAFFHSSRHVVTGPTNAVSLLVGSVAIGLIADGRDPLVLGISLALMVGCLQLLAGALRLGSLVDFVSGPVVLGYITGAGLLIAIGQLPNLTGNGAG